MTNWIDESELIGEIKHSVVGTVLKATRPGEDRRYRVTIGGHSHGDSGVPWQNTFDADLINVEGSSAALEPESEFVMSDDIPKRVTITEDAPETTYAVIEIGERE